MQYELTFNAIDNILRNEQVYVAIALLIVIGVICCWYNYYKTKKRFFIAYNELTPIAKKLTAKEHYLTGSERDRFSEQADNNGFVDLYRRKQNASYVKNDPEISKTCALINNIAIGGEDFRSNHNKKVIMLLKEKYKEYLTTRLDYPLDEQQRDAIIVDEDNTLVVSSAGSGKTSTIVGKTYYLIEKLHVDPKKILLITFTRKASSELSARLGVEGLRCKTFHKLAKDIIAKHSGKQPNYADDLNYDVKKAFREMLQDKNYRERLSNYLLFHFDSEDMHNFKTAEEFYQDKGAYGAQTLVPDSYGNIKYTKSNQEKRIFHFLYSLGVEFIYERLYEYDVRGKDRRQYKPDFAIIKRREIVDGKEKLVFLYFEHFGINSKGQPAPHFENRADYVSGIEWKKMIHRHYKTDLVYTTSGDFENDTWRNKIMQFLAEHNIKTSPRSSEEIAKAVIDSTHNKNKAIKDMLTAFINLMKEGEYTLQSVKDEIAKNKDDKNKIVVEELIEPVYNHYQKRLKEMDAMDFSDSIKLATELCDKGYKEEYDYILVDEFQDISMERYKFLQSLRRAIPLTKMFCVGDDWQSIYRFSGSDMALFYDFKKFFGYTEERKIERTYRFGEPLITLSSDFIQKNPNQKKKKVFAGKPDARTEYEFVEYEPSKEDKLSEFRAVENIVKSLPKDSSIYLLGRYKKSSVFFPHPKTTAGDDKIEYNIASHKCTYITAHSSKGLEADYIIVIGCTCGVYGFPSRVVNHEVLSYVLSKSDDYLYSEDRRLFYVAMTRAKKKTFIVHPSSGVSEFINELNPSDRKDNLCPLCKAGTMRLRRSRTAYNGNECQFWCCDNWSARCPHTENRWINHNPIMPRIPSNAQLNAMGIVLPKPAPAWRPLTQPPPDAPKSLQDCNGDLPF